MWGEERCKDWGMGKSKGARQHGSTRVRKLQQGIGSRGVVAGYREGASHDKQNGFEKGGGRGGLDRDRDGNGDKGGHGRETCDRGREDRKERERSEGREREEKEREGEKTGEQRWQREHNGSEPGGEGAKARQGGRRKTSHSRDGSARKPDRARVAGMQGMCVVRRVCVCGEEGMCVVGRECVCGEGMSGCRVCVWGGKDLVNVYALVGHERHDKPQRTAPKKTDAVDVSEVHLQEGWGVLLLGVGLGLLLLSPIHCVDISL